MFDTFNRNINYLRISVTDRCNLRCIYCMPNNGVKWLPSSQIMSFETIVAVVKAAVEFGIVKIKLTGGEPLVREDLVELVTMLNAIEKIQEISMTTNGTLLRHFAKPLAQAGLRRVNISLDTLDPEKYHQLTRGGNLNDVLEGIRVARQAGLTPIKLNCVIDNGTMVVQKQQISAFAVQNGLAVQFIHKMDLAKGIFDRVEGGNGGNCAQCNRLRLTGNGVLKPCLFSDQGYSIFEYSIKEAIRLAILNKPRSGERSHDYAFYNVGG